MQQTSIILFLEINTSNFIFLAGKKDEQDNFKIILIMKSNQSDLITINFDLEKFLYNKENIYLIEQKLNLTFKEVV